MKTGISSLIVGIDFGSGIASVGRLASRDQLMYFEYDGNFFQQGIEISPLKLPLRTGVLQLPTRPFDGLAGVFADSLPDGWGRLLMDRKLKANGSLPSSASSLYRLSYVGIWGMGALVFQPEQSVVEEKGMIELDFLARQTEEVLRGSSSGILDELLSLNGSSAGARPKALIGLNETRDLITHGEKELKHGFEPWIVKFPNTQDGIDAGAIEYCYSLLAKEAGIIMPETHLFPSRIGPGYFAVKRFDRIGSKRLHMHTAAGLLHADFRVPSLDYEDLLNLTGFLTKDVREVEKMFRLAVFNVLAHNRDDHAKNFSFLMDNTGTWRLAPGYDLTFSSGPAGQQSTMVLGEGKNPRVSLLSKLGLEAGLSKSHVNSIVDQTRTALEKWDGFAKEFGVSDSFRAMISKAIRIDD